jgi:Leucine-rich repeat (LRR) protein
MVIEGLDGLVKLTDLTLFNNRISIVEGMDNLVNLKVLSLGNNQIGDLNATVLYLAKYFHSLNILTLLGNPLSKDEKYNNYVISHLKHLKYLDYKLIEETQLKSAKEEFINELMALDQVEKDHLDKVMTQQKEIEQKKLLQVTKL